MELLIHSRAPHGSKERRYTLAAVIKSIIYPEKDGKPEREEITMNVGYAICSERDIFERRKGRLIATGRAEKRPAMSVAATGEMLKDFQIFKQLFKDFPNMFKDKVVNPHLFPRKKTRTFTLPMRTNDA